MPKKLFHRFRTDKEFRRNVIIGVIVGLFILNARSDIGTQAFASQPTCDTCGEGLGICDPLECINLGCAPIETTFGTGCKSGWDIGDEICLNDPWLENYPNVFPENMCKDGLVAIKQSTVKCIGDKWVCVTEEVADTTGAITAEPCKSWQRGFAKFTRAIFKKSDFECSTAAYIAVGGIILIVVAVL